ncbi:MAG: hypothetical protein SFY81_16305 [Verrucomicrobiota bacterium]|nr:hypothetical protein [Verrucomicrobiota bacterium]
MNFRPLTIVGGGLAGLATALLLREKDLPVELHEAGSYPRHRVCGEFISGAGLDFLSSALFKDDSPPWEGKAINSVRWHLDGLEISLSLPQPACTLSRHVLDLKLACLFRDRGGVLHENSRINASGPGVVRATGRRSASSVHGWRYFGLKVHAVLQHPLAELRVFHTMHGYVGINPVEGHWVNICGLFRTGQPVPDLATRWQEWLCDDGSPALRQFLAGAEFRDGSFTATAALPMTPLSEIRNQPLCLGDAMGMIPPFTGNGMSIAFESAMIAAPVLAAYSRHRLDWNETVTLIQSKLVAAFLYRIRRAYWIQQLLWTKTGRFFLFGTVKATPSMFSLMFRLTR